MTESVTLKEKLRYRFDDFMAKGSKSAFISLMVVFLSLLLLISTVRIIAIALLGDVNVERGDSTWRQAYVTFLELTDPGSMTQDVDSSPYVKVFAVLSGLIGIVLFSALIAFVTTALDQKINNLRKGHSKVIENDHSLILGWNDRVLDILRELILANESEDSATVVILADMDKEEMDDYLALNLTERKTTKIVTRSGLTSSPVNLKVASAENARSVIILAQAVTGEPKEELERSDISVIKSILAMRQLLDPTADVPVVAELFSPQRRELAKSIDPKHVVCLDADEILAKILVQTSRSEGLAVVYEEILSFDGAEMYFYQDRWAGARFGDVGFHLPDGVPLGYVNREGTVSLNPDPHYVLADDDELVVLASDDSTISLHPSAVVTPRWHEPTGLRRPLQSEHELIIGWTPKFETLVMEYGDYVGAGSKLDVVLRQPDETRVSRAHELDEMLSNISMTVTNCDPFDVDQLAALDPAKYDNVIILSQAGQEDGTEWADAETLLILIQLQHILADKPQPHPTLIAEVLDSKNRELVTQTGVSEFIISNRLISMLAAQLSEDDRLFSVYDNLFSEDGSEVYLKPLSLYFQQLPAQLTYADLMAAALKRGEVALGYRSLRVSREGDSNGGVRLIPPKQDLLTLNLDDYVVVLAEDET